MGIWMNIWRRHGLGFFSCMVKVGCGLIMLNEIELDALVMLIA